MKVVFSFCELKLPLPIIGPIKPCDYFPVACVISQITLNFIFSACMLVLTKQFFTETVIFVIAVQHGGCELHHLVSNPFQLWSVRHTDT